MTELTSIPSWLLGNHLGSTSMATDDSGVLASEVRYSAFGEIRYDSGTMTTDYLYTGQREEAEIGLYYYVARWYDPAIGRFIQADSIVPNPGSAKGFDRYSYGYNNPLSFTDPSGHFPQEPPSSTPCIDGICLPNGEPGTSPPAAPPPSTPPSGGNPGQAPYLTPPSSSPNIPEFNPYLYNPDTGVKSGLPSGYRDLEGMLIFIQHVGLNFVNQIGEGIDAVNAAKLIRGGWKMGRASLPLGFAIEGGVSGILQFVIDSNDPALSSLNTGQKVGRAFFIALEAGVTDVAANTVGTALVAPGAAAGSAVPGVGTAAGGFVGFEAGSIATTIAADAMFSKFNSWLFTNFGWGGYP